MRIGLTGAGGTGKGTLGKMLAKEFDFVFLPSHIQDTGIKIGLNQSYNQETSPEFHKIFQYSILFGQIYQERALQIADTSYIAERTVIDYLPYYLQKIEEIDKNFNYAKIINDWAKNNYDIIFYLPIEFTPTDIQENKWKERDEKLRKLTDFIIYRELYVMNKFENVYTIKGTEDERFKIAKNIIERNFL